MGWNKFSRAWRLWTAPAASVAPDKFIGGLWPPRAGFVCQDAFARLVLPFVQNALDETPRGLDFIAAREQRLIADHAIEQQTFVGFRLGAGEGRAVEEIHVDGANLHFDFRPRHFGRELERDAFVRLDTQYKDVRFNLAVRLALLEENKRWLLERDGDFRDALGQMFAGTQVEGNVGPAPVVDVGFERDIGLCQRNG